MKVDEPVGVESEFPINVIEAKFGSCGHYGRLFFKDNEEFLECADCGEKITMREGVKRMLSSEHRFQRNWARDKLITEELAKKQKCKCEHCGRMTHIRTEVTDSKIMDLVYERKAQEMKFDKADSLKMKFQALRWLRIDQRCMFIATEVGGYSADVLGINENKMVEIEVKTTMVDFRNDFKKSKHLQYTTYDPATGHDYAWYKQWVPTHFYFAVPSAMVEDVKAYLETAKAPRAKDYGVISAEEWIVVKRAKWLHKNPPGSRAKATCALRMGSELIRMHEAWV